MTTIKNFQDITYRKKSIAWGIILTEREKGYTLKKYINPCWAKRAEKNGDFISLVQHKSGKSTVYIPYKWFKIGDKITVQNGKDKRELWTVTALNKMAAEFSVESVAIPERKIRDYKTRAAEPEPLELELAPELGADCPFEIDGENDGGSLERALMIDKLHGEGFNLAALRDLNESELDALYAQYGR